ncbi:MAG: hypothetical protein J5741_02025 [Bacteroidales bacterium]|nr:hypothetical protein [Bacteroidales bacterium]
MRKSLAYFLVCFCTLCLMPDIQAQEDISTPKDSVDASPLSPDFMPVYLSALPSEQYEMLQYKPLDTNMFYTPQTNPLSDPLNLYQSLGIFAQAHKNMIFEYDRQTGFSMITLPFPLYFRKQQDLSYFDVSSSYTKLNYTYGLATENSFQALHTQKVRQFRFTFDLNGYSNQGYYIHQGANMFTMNVFAHYQTPKNKYGVFVSYLLNHGKYAENGGLTDHHEFADRQPLSAKVFEYSNYSVLFSNASTLINTHDVFLMQYFNMEGKKQGFYFGTLTHTLQFKQVSSLFYDHNLNNDFYQNQFYINTDTTRDTIQYYSISNALQWSNYRPFDTVSSQHYFFRIAGGVRHEYVGAFMPYYRGNTMTLFARTNIRLFSVWDIFGGISYSFFGYNKNDARASVKATFAISRKNSHYIGFTADFYRVSPDYFYSYYIGNNSLWYNEWPKQNSLKLSAYWTRKEYKLSFNYYMLHHYIFMNSHYVPEMSNSGINVIQLQAQAPVRIHNFAMDVNVALQHSTKSYIAVPLFAGKLSAAYCFRIFKKRLKIQLGGDLMFNTSYYADIYNPLLHQFCHQEEVKVGNYLYLDLHLSFRVKRISFFVRGGNLLAGLMGYHYITTPYYPTQAQNLRIGINWRFYD